MATRTMMKVPVSLSEEIEFVRGDDLDSIYEHLGGYFEVVRTQRLVDLTQMLNDQAGNREMFPLNPHRLVMVVDDEGLVKGKDTNLRAQYLSGYPGRIAGTVLISAEGWEDDGYDLINIPEPIIDLLREFHPKVTSQIKDVLDGLGLEESFVASFSGIASAMGLLPFPPTS